MTAGEGKQFLLHAFRDDLSPAPFSVGVMPADLGAQQRRQNVGLIGSGNRQRPQHFRGKGGRFPALEEIQVIFGSGQPHVVKPAFFLIRSHFVIGLRLRPGNGRKNAVDHIRHVNGVVFQPLAGVNRGKDDPAVLCVPVFGDRHLQCLQLLKEAVRTVNPFCQHLKDKVLAGIQLLLLHILPVMHMIPDAVQSRLRIVRFQFGQVLRQVDDSVLNRSADTGSPDEEFKQASLRGPALLNRAVCRIFGDGSAELIVETQEQVGIAGLRGKAENVKDIRHDTVGKEKLVDIPAVIRDPVFLQPVDQRQRRVVVAEKNGRFAAAVHRHVHKILVLKRT